MSLAAFARKSRNWIDRRRSAWALFLAAEAAASRLVKTVAHRRLLQRLAFFVTNEREGPDALDLGLSCLDSGDELRQRTRHLDAELCVSLLLLEDNAPVSDIRLLDLA